MDGFEGFGTLGNVFAGGGQLRGELARLEGQQRGARIQQALQAGLLDRERARREAIGNSALLSLPERFSSAPSLFGNDTNLQQQLAPILSAVFQASPNRNLNQASQFAPDVTEALARIGLAQDIENGTFDQNKANNVSQAFTETPVQLTDNQGDTLLNRFVTPDRQASVGGNVPTAIGESRISANNALASNRINGANVPPIDPSNLTARDIFAIAAGRNSGLNIGIPAGGNVLVNAPTAPPQAASASPAQQPTTNAPVPKSVASGLTDADTREIDQLRERFSGQVKGLTPAVQDLVLLARRALDRGADPDAVFQRLGDEFAKRNVQLDQATTRNVNRLLTGNAN